MQEILSQTQLLDCCVCLNEDCEVGGLLYPADASMKTSMI
jgi:hypothetical protein